MNYFDSLVIVSVDGIIQMFPESFMEVITMYKKGIRNLMIAVLDVNIKDYMTTFREDRLGNEKVQRARMTRGQKAKYYLFDDNTESDTYVFGFKFICRYLKLDPDKLRNKLRKIKSKSDVDRIIELKDADGLIKKEGYFL